MLVYFHTAANAYLYVLLLLLPLACVDSRIALVSRTQGRQPTQQGREPAELRALWRCALMTCRSASPFGMHDGHYTEHPSFSAVFRLRVYVIVDLHNILHA
jgi:hypothetical protein